MIPGAAALTCKPNILVYIGPGTSRRAVEETFASLREAAPHHCLVPANRRLLGTPHWQRDTALVVLPGGRDSLYDTTLAGEPNANIRAFVAAGGGYLGICAGAYYAADHMAFGLDLPGVTVQGPRPLKFYPGLCLGPMTQSFDYDDYRGAQAWPVWPSGAMAYYHGGGTFVDAQNKPEVEVLHSYDHEGRLAATVACRHGEGLAVLTGLHLEYSGLRLSDGYPPALLATLIGSEATRRAEFARLVQRSLEGDACCLLPATPLLGQRIEQSGNGGPSSLADRGHVLKV